MMINNLQYKDYIIDLSGAKLKKKIPVIDQGNKLGFWGWKIWRKLCSRNIKTN